MLRRVLASLASGRTHTLEGLAFELEVDRGAIEDMLTQLCKLGYAEELTASMSASCGDDVSSACAGCSGCALGCGQSPQGRVWSLTAKGRTALVEQ
jgi:hypothetical protein